MIRIINKHNRPKREKGVRDVDPRTALIELWNNPYTKISIPSEEIPGYDIHTLVHKMVNKPEQVRKY